MAGLVVAVALRRVAVDQRAAEHRMGLASHLVLDREQHLAGVEVDEARELVAKPPDDMCPAPSWPLR